MALTRLIDWMNLLSSEERLYKDDDLSIHVYGEGDQSYIVIEITLSSPPRLIDQYTIHPLDQKQALFALVCFLKECDYNSKTVASKISSAEYLEEDMNDIARFDSVEIARYQVQENCHYENQTSSSHKKIDTKKRYNS